jgi:hypothetical protein
MGFLGRAKSNSGGKDRSPAGDKLPKELTVAISSINYPNAGTVRVNYGETVSALNLMVRNKSQKAVSLGVNFYLAQENVSKVKYIDREQVELGPDGMVELGPFRQLFEKGKFQPGKYYFKAELVSLEKDQKGEILDTASRYLFLEQDPPQKSLFEKIDKVEYPEEMKKLTGEARETGKSRYIFMYNIAHPRYLGTQNEWKAEYLVSIMAPWLCTIDLNSESPILFEADELEDPIKIVKKALKLQDEILYDFIFEKTVG